MGAVVAGTVAGLGAWLLAIGVVHRRQPLERAIARLHRSDVGHLPTVASGGSLRRWTYRQLGGVSLSARRRADLAVLGLGPERFSAQLAATALAGLAVPGVLAGLLRTSGAAPGLLATVWVCLLGGVTGAGLVASRTRNRAGKERLALRLQLGAYLDVLAMLLAAGEADEQALQLAAAAGDGRMFEALQRAYRDAARVGQPMLTGMHRLGESWDLSELKDIAAAGSLATSDGAAVRRTLMTKARSLRTAQLAEEETDARLRTNKLGFPQILMAVAFLILVLYPAFVGLLDGVQTGRP